MAVAALWACALGEKTQRASSAEIKHRNVIEIRRFGVIGASFRQRTHVILNSPGVKPSFCVSSINITDLRPNSSFPPLIDSSDALPVRNDTPPVVAALFPSKSLLRRSKPAPSKERR